MHLVNSKIAKPPQILFEKHKFEAPKPKFERQTEDSNISKA